jgi:hypothetical protein
MYRDSPICKYWVYVFEYHVHIWLFHLDSLVLLNFWKYKFKKKKIWIIHGFCWKSYIGKKLEILGFYNGFEFVSKEFAQLINFDGIQQEKNSLFSSITWCTRVCLLKLLCKQHVTCYHKEILTQTQRFI